MRRTSTKLLVSAERKKKLSVERKTKLLVVVRAERKTKLLAQYASNVKRNY